MAGEVVITEHNLGGFRAEYLTPPALLESIERYVRLLLRLSVGVGKSFAAEQFLVWLPLYKRFNLVVYLAPRWSILNERIARLDRDKPPVRTLIIRPRPRDLCGKFNRQWEQFERASCSALGKQEICRDRCPKYENECTWPDQWKHLENTSLVLAPEKHAELNRSLIPLLLQRTESTRPLVILDEARLLDANFEIRLSRSEIERFSQALMRTHSRRKGLDGVRGRWLESIDSLLAATPQDFVAGYYEFYPWLHAHAFAIQKAGWSRFGEHFRYSGYDLSQLTWSRRDERWMDGDDFVFIARPYLACHTLLLSASLTADYAGHRLGCGPVASPFETTRFTHTASRIYNLRDRCGAKRNFKGNKGRILDTFALMIVRNIFEGRTTLLVSKKELKADCAKYLQWRLGGWGLEVQFLIEDSQVLPVVPDPRIIPMLHYGILGVNDFEGYESAYCVNSFYIKDSDLNRELQSFEPKQFRVEMQIVTGPDRQRRVRQVVSDDSEAERNFLGEVYLRKLEVDPVVQVVGRVRFMTKPREVVFFQMNDMARDIPGCQDLTSLVHLREMLGLPEPREVDEVVEGREAQRLMAGGLTAGEAGERLDLGRRTVFRRLDAVESAKRHEKGIFLMRFGTLPASAGGAA